MFAQQAAWNMVKFRHRLLERVSHTAPTDIHLGVVSNTVRETSGCEPGELWTIPTGQLEHAKGEVPILTAESDAETWVRRLGRHDYCGLPQYFEAMRFAMDGRNPGFPRPGALLLILLMAPDNDCSLKDASLLSKAELWPPGFHHYYARCCQPPKGLLYDVGGYVDALLRQHSQKIFVYVATVPRPATFLPDGSYYYVKNLVACEGLSGTCTAAPRLASFDKAIEARKDPRLRVRMADITKPGCMDLFTEDLVDEIVRFGEL
ncbi:MAG: hypothetical protein KAI47_17315 [Deltaproteobacteria bacterium]|nr:hypothetical protein [Deltaproteobacteria bacterium]